MSDKKPVRPQGAHLTYHERERFHETRIKEMKIVGQNFNDEKLVEIADTIDNANRVFVAALGRSRLNIMAFATRLRQMRIQSFVVGDVTTPSIHKGDVFLIASSSGKTASLVAFAKKAAEVGATIILFTESDTSPIGDLATLVYKLEVDVERDDLTKHPGLYSEYGINLCFECMVMYLMKKRGVTPEKMQAELANLY